VLNEKKNRKRKVTFLKSSRLSYPQVRLWLDPILSHNALQAEILEIIQAVAKTQTKE